MEGELKMDALRWSVLGGMSESGFSLVSENKKGRNGSMNKLRFVPATLTTSYSVEVTIQRIGIWINILAKVAPGSWYQTHTTKLACQTAEGSSADFTGDELSKEGSIKVVNEVLRPVIVDSAHVLGHQGPRNLDNIPNDLAEKIMLLLDIEDVLSLGQTCKALKAVSDLDSVWKGMHNKVFKSPDNLTDQTTWRAQYQLSLARQKARESQEQLNKLMHERTLIMEREFPARVRNRLGLNPVGEVDRLPQLGAGIGYPFAQRHFVNHNTEFRRLRRLDGNPIFID